jgi:hypothetical protein
MFPETLLRSKGAMEQVTLTGGYPTSKTISGPVGASETPGKRSQSDAAYSPEPGCYPLGMPE